MKIVHRRSPAALPEAVRLPSPLRSCSTAADAGQSALLCAHPKPAALHDLGAVPQLDQFSVRTVHQVPYKDLHWGVVPELHPSVLSVKPDLQFPLLTEAQTQQMSPPGRFLLIPT